MSNSLEKTTVGVQSRKQANVLLVDDQPAKLLTYQAILGDLGTNLVTASSAREALDQLLKNEFAVVIVDVCMPELDGFELAEMIRDHPRFRQTAIIFVSGVHLTDLDRLKGYQRGAVDYLPVPIVPEILRAKVQVFVDLHLKTRELERLNKHLERRVAERTEELEEAARRKDQFLAVLAHELRNPLAAIRMFLAGEPPIDGDLLSDVRTRIAELHVGYIVIHSTMLDPGRLQSILRLLSNLSGLTRLDSDPEVIVFRVDA